jgi:hypothetical protein
MAMGATIPAPVRTCWQNRAQRQSRINRPHKNQLDFAVAAIHIIALNFKQRVILFAAPILRRGLKKQLLKLLSPPRRAKILIH